MRLRRSQATPRHRTVRRLPEWLKGLLTGLLIGVPAVSGVYLAGQHLLKPETFPVKRVRVNGEFRHLSRQELEKAVAPHIGEGLLRLDVEEVRRAVEKLAWVRSVQVRRAWPEGLELRVSEQQPLARWGAGGLVNISGEWFAAPAASVPEGLPLLSGPEGSSATVTEHFREFATVLASADLLPVVVALDRRNAWRVQLQSGLEIDLGREDVSRRLQRFARLYRQLFARTEKKLKRVDLRYANGFAVQFAQAQEGKGAQEKPQGVTSNGELAHAKKG
ncbi:MAG: cell division protein FtsQ/DivIB [Gammaproteobacteria bacterium]